MKISLKAVTLMAALALALPMTTLAVTVSFPECPAVGNDTTGCELLITVTAVNGSGAATAFSVAASSPDLGPYDGSDDTLVGILNSSGSILKSIGLSSSTDIFAFDGDGACTFITCTGTTDPSGYAPKGVTFSGINPSGTSGTVNFSPTLANGKGSWFSLEEALNPSLITSSTPEPATFALLGAGALMAFFATRRRRA